MSGVYSVIIVYARWAGNYLSRHNTVQRGKNVLLHPTIVFGHLSIYISAASAPFLRSRHPWSGSVAGPSKPCWVDRNLLHDTDRKHGCVRHFCSTPSMSVEVHSMEEYSVETAILLNLTLKSRPPFSFSWVLNWETDCGWDTGLLFRNSPTSKLFVFLSYLPHVIFTSSAMRQPDLSIFSELFFVT